MEKNKIFRKNNNQKIFRYKARVFTTIFGIAGCTALILAGFGLKDSIKEVTNYQFNNIFKYDKTLIINENKDYNLIKNYITNDNDINKFTEVNTQTITIEYNNKEQDVTLVTPNNFKELKT